MEDIVNQSVLSKKLYNSNDIKKGDIILFIDKESKKIRGIDKVISIHSNEYQYNPLKEPNHFSLPHQQFTGNLTKFLNQYDAYLVDESFSHNYSDESLKSSILSWDYDYVFSDILWKDTGSALWSLLTTEIQRNIDARVNFINLTKKYEHVLHLLIFQDTQHQVSNIAISEIRQDVLNFIKNIR